MASLVSKNGHSLKQFYRKRGRDEKCSFVECSVCQQLHFSLVDVDNKVPNSLGRGWGDPSSIPAGVELFNYLFYSRVGDGGLSLTCIRWLPALTVLVQ